MTVNCGHKREKSVVAKRWRVRIVPREAEETTVGSGFSQRVPGARYWMLCRDDSASDSRTCSPPTKTIISCQKSCYVNALPVLDCRSEIQLLEVQIYLIARGGCSIESLSHHMIRCLREIKIYHMYIYNHDFLLYISKNFQFLSYPFV